MVVSFGTDRDVLVRLPISYSDAEGARMVDVLRQANPQDITLQRMEFVGPQVGDELREQGGPRNAAGARIGSHLRRFPFPN